VFFIEIQILIILKFFLNKKYSNQHFMKNVRLLIKNEQLITINNKTFDWSSYFTAYWFIRNESILQMIILIDMSQ
jgi:hypothetical protein